MVSVQVELVDEERARITVADTGVGIAPDHLDTLFDPFTQAHDRREYGGTGLGLAISQRYTELMGSRIEVASEVGVGSRFWIDLELAPRI
jgi:signal transduction histidine kinase